MSRPTHQSDHITLLGIMFCVAWMASGQLWCAAVFSAIVMLGDSALSTWWRRQAGGDDSND